MIAMVNICKIDGCKRQIDARGYCSPHYKRWRRAGFTERFNKSPLVRIMHDVNNLSRSPMYKTWEAMLRRCHDPKNRAYKHYGARGIKVTERWHDFNVFYAEVGDKPSQNHSLDRIDNNGGYGPGNVRWATPAQQAQNRRMSPRNKSGYTGVSLEQGKYWRVTFERDGRRIRKSFTSKSDAISYRKKLEGFDDKLVGVDNSNLMEILGA